MQRGDDSIESLRALGPMSRRLLEQIGVTSASQLRARDPFDLYAQLKAFDNAVSLNMLYALIAAIEDRESRLANANRLLDWSGSVGVGRMGFRWFRVRQLLTDLHGGLKS